MLTPMETKALNNEDKTKANMKKTAAILQALRALHSEGIELSEETNESLVWTASDLLDEALEIDAAFLREQNEHKVAITFKEISVRETQLAAVAQ